MIYHHVEDNGGLFPLVRVINSNVEYLSEMLSVERAGQQILAGYFLKPVLELGRIHQCLKDGLRAGFAILGGR
jgi:hypothetical protein